MKEKENFETLNLVGKLCSFRGIMVLVVKKEKSIHHKHNKNIFGKRYYALFPGQGIDILPASSLKVIC